MNKSIVSETLYRKYRPMSFDTVLGQSEVVDTLRNAIGSGSIAHAYLFSGGRGTGKTSIARIFARELGTDEQDIIEIDAASNRGINEIRELKSGVDTLPFASDYKVYIIDEVHMLTKEAFNALLKTLEEPPTHVIFVLATTEKHKVLDTILSRCQVYDFKLAINDTLIELVNNVCKKENRKISEEAADFIATKGNGSFRDTLSYLQKALVLTDAEITKNVLDEYYGSIDSSGGEQLLDAISQKDSVRVMSLYHEMSQTGTQGGPGYAKLLILFLLRLTRETLMVRYSPTIAQQIAQRDGEGKVEYYKNLTGITSSTLRGLLNVYEQALKTDMPAHSLEVFLIGLLEQDA